MRARYYSPEMKRFVNADIVAGEISNAVTLNRFAYANGNPVSLIDPFGLATITEVSAGEADLDPTDNHEHFGIGGGGAGGGFYGYDASAYHGGSYSNYLVRNNTANYDAARGGYYYEGTTASFETLGKYIVPGLVSVNDSMSTSNWQNRPVNKPTNVDGQPHGSETHKAGIAEMQKKMEKSGEYSDIWLNKSLETAGLEGNQRPDIIAKRHSGDYEYYEFASKSQEEGSYGYKKLVTKMGIIDNANNLHGVLIKWGDY